MGLHFALAADGYNHLQSAPSYVQVGHTDPAYNSGSQVQPCYVQPRPTQTCYYQANPQPAGYAAVPAAASAPADMATGKTISCIYGEPR
uniref:Uncharacterized protein n=1 Tax=Medicago truncatula TaxID=3880 RepID=A2Q470_MEDTR|nr:hypothetical protein MtrDRAFT_AC157373g27v2 [Medicago truncatula]